MNDNPLAGYFRKPAIHMTLPSKGNFYPAGSLEMPETKELPVYPMTALDEITYRTPDALFNGSAIVDVIQSCIPSIKNAWEMPSIDIPSILANIRIASFGHEMDINTVCPSCEEPANYQFDLRSISDSLKVTDYTKPLKLGDMQIFFKPLTYRDMNDNSKLNFEEQQMNKVINDAEMSEEDRIRAMSEAFTKISTLTLDALTNNIMSIKTPEATVTEPEYILDFIKHCDRDIFKKIRDEIAERRKGTDLKPIKIVCEECGHEYTQPFTLDMTTFFE